MSSLVKPHNYALAANIVVDLARSKSEILLESAFLRQQLIIQCRQVKQSLTQPRHRLLPMMLAGHLRNWKQVLLLVQPKL